MALFGACLAAYLLVRRGQIGDHMPTAILPRRQKERIAVRAPMRPKVRHITDQPERHACSPHPENFGALALGTNPLPADVPKSHGTHLANPVPLRQRRVAVKELQWAGMRCRARDGNIASWMDRAVHKGTTSAAACTIRDDLVLVLVRKQGTDRRGPELLLPYFYLLLLSIGSSATAAPSLRGSEAP